MNIYRSTNKFTATSTSDITNEIQIMQKLKSPYLVSLLEVIDDPTSKQVYLILEFVEGGAILPDETITDPLPHDLAWSYFRDMIKGVIYMHSQVRTY